ncbi:cytochrome P450 [Lophiostoma macrostomum CBS 122681]|uniref:Cytochrome P450 n=1 Tax=Lophiostoma macrostomum CBS 122681 TaxID=1314788 RepID=A0A6A6SVX8_9PLEO|nr:cytochrome P450 [Lophiostoma macrostomum CBS 122681]
MSAESSFVLQSLAFAALLLGLLFVLQKWKGRDDKDIKWKDLDTVGVSHTSLFPWTRALVRSLVATHQNAHDGYRIFSKAQGLPFALPTIWKGGAVAVLPASTLHLLHKPESELKAFDAQLETIQLPYFIADRDIYMNVFHFDVARKHLVNNRDVAALAAATADEVDVAFHDVWGTSKEWTTGNAWDVCGRIITRSATRILIGMPACRDEVLFEQTRLFSDNVILGTALINCLPPFLRPAFGTVVGWKAKYHQSRCLRILVPFVEDRMRIFRSGKEGADVPNDFLQWLIARCAKEGPEQMKTEKVALRLLTFNAMFIIGMFYVFSHCVLDIFGSPASEDYLEGLVAECEDVSARYDGFATKEAVDHLYRVDSAIRESMRVSDIAVTALARDVVGAKLDLGNGAHIPRGVRVVWPTQAIHQDPNFYPDPLRFDAFRYSRMHEGKEDSKGEPGSERDALTTVTPTFLSFGYGKHVCPGRWFASQTMKQALAHILLNYDVEVTHRREKRQVLLNMMVPATDAKIRFRRKERQS